MAEPTNSEDRLICPECGTDNVRTDEIGHQPGKYPDLYRLMACRECPTTWNVVYRPVEANEIEQYPPPEADA